MTGIIEITPSEIGQLDLKEKYRLVKGLEHELTNKELKEMINIRHGYETHFDIYTIFNGYEKTKWKNDYTIIEGEKINLKDYHNEIEKREQTLTKILLRLSQEENDITKGRT